MDVMLEQVARRIDLIMRGSLPAALDAVAAEMVAEDVAYFGAIGVSPVPATPLPHPAQYYVGHHPTVLDRPLDTFPNLTTMCYRHRAQELGGADQIEDMGNIAYVEAFISAADEGTANRTAWRFARAIHRVVFQNPTLGGLSMPVGLTPDVDVSNVSARRVSDRTDDVVYIQGARLEYIFEVNVPR